jgi:hypothetical protein
LALVHLWASIYADTGFLHFCLKKYPNQTALPCE